MYYGLTSKSQIKETAKKIVELLGGGDNAISLIVETVAAETLSGSYKAPVRYNYGLGLTQFDKIAFQDVRERTSVQRKKLILDNFNICK